MEEKRRLINELYECVKETLERYGIKSEMKEYEDAIDIHDTRSDFEEDKEGIRIRFQKENGRI